MTADEAISYIHSMAWNRQATGYEHAKRLLHVMGNPEKKLKYVHIGGTNGKGSTAAMIASVLQQAGYKTGLYTSPYIYRFHERMQINGEQISNEDLAEVTEYVKAYVDTMPEGLSEFAIVCCIAFEYFARKQCDIVVLEVGMGGANDSTNVIDCPEVAVMTNIGLDHTEYLGKSLDEIAITKAGIFKENGDAIIYPSEPSVQTVFRDICKKRNIRMVCPDLESIVLETHSLEGQVFSYKERREMFLPLLGEHQLKNAVVAISTIDILKEKGWDISDNQLIQGLKQVKWPGRFEVISKDPLFIIDGGHNPQCIEALAQNVRKYLFGRRIIAITGVLKDKDYAGIYQPIMDDIHEFLCITPQSPRKLPAEELATYLREAGAKATACESVKESVKLAQQITGKEGAVLCFGSLYLIAEIQDAFEKVHLH